MQKEILSPAYDNDEILLDDTLEEQDLHAEQVKNQESQFPHREKIIRGLAQKAFEDFDVPDDEVTFESTGIEQDLEVLRGEIVTYRDEARDGAYAHIELLNKSAEQLHVLSGIVKQGGFENLDLLRQEILDVREVIEENQRLSKQDETLRSDAMQAIMASEDNVATRVKNSAKKLERLTAGIRKTIASDTELFADIDAVSQTDDRQLLARQIDDIVAKLRNRSDNFYHQPSAELVSILQTVARDIEAE